MVRSLKIWQEREKVKLKELFDSGATVHGMASYFHTTPADIAEALRDIGITRSMMILRGAK